MEQIIKRKPGRPFLPDSERGVVVTLRLTPARREKLRRLGPEWLAKQIDNARE